jgi:hypothetical protein
MKPVAPTVSASCNRRFVLVIGLAVGVAVPLSHVVRANAETSLGSLGAFALGLAAAAAVGGLLALGVAWLLGPSSKSSA